MLLLSLTRNSATQTQPNQVTLQTRRINGKEGNRAIAHEQQLAITVESEKALVRWVVRLYGWGFPPRMNMVRHMATKLAEGSI